ncbi:ABC transporter ATP-binding protein [Roseicitreum antarcticum]|uniref:Multiple sugar transport system ATP-binding protein n=1 Tax=Roseicitreum antarcticum TaxID=564137 RepID=A0A1H2YYL1_9RHOB|nr:ABC transporter ATP-binding protein [Roseicitreum antarcticum]SDX10253.1 multiple sugar transport system ATP-binding protein [Roseicitreum antarcticum]
MADVVFSNVQKSFGTFTAVRDLDLTIKSGEFVSLLGPSGCGKTTTLRMLAGLEFPSGGEIRIDGKVVNDTPPGKRDIAMVFQSYALYPHMTVGKNIAYPLKKRRVPTAERDQMVAKVADMLQLTPLLARKPGQLSGGQQQRVALGRALVRDPKVFLLDEPLSNLDAKLRGYMRAELVELHARLGRTMVYVTHDQLEAMTMSDRIAIMLNGDLQQFAPPQQVYRAPANRFVAGFIGTPSMNLVDGELSRVGDGWRLRTDTLDLPVGPLIDQAQPGPACMGIRPEGLTIGTGDNTAEVLLVEETGHENIVTLRLGTSTRLTARTPADQILRMGTRVPFSIDTSALHVFGPGETGPRLNVPVPFEPAETPTTPHLVGAPL